MINALSCLCTAKKQFASHETLRKHKQSMKHIHWELKTECRAYKLETMQLKQSLCKLVVARNVAAAHDWKCMICQDSLPLDYKLCPDAVAAYCAHHDDEPYSVYQS